MSYKHIFLHDSYLIQEPASHGGYDAMAVVLASSVRNMAESADFML